MVVVLLAGWGSLIGDVFEYCIVPFLYRACLSVVFFGPERETGPRAASQGKFAVTVLFG